MNKAQKIIDSQNNRIKELENQLKIKNNTNIINNNNEENIIIQSLKEQINQKDEELKELRVKLQNKDNSTKAKLIPEEKITCVYFTSVDQNINYPIPCVKTDIFAEIEEKLYKEYPKYRETNNNFLVNGMQILRFKSIEENRINNGQPVMLVTPTDDWKLIEVKI